MNHKDYKKICAACFPIVKSVGKFISGEIEQLKPGDIETKSLNSLVSYVDKEAEKMLVSGLIALTPSAGFITEEGTIEQRQLPLTWIIDPLDGTNNYLHQIPHYAISIALMSDQEVVIGLVYNPSNGELFHAIKGQGAFLNDRKISTSKTSHISDSVIATGFPYSVDQKEPILKTLEFFMMNARGIRRFGAAALDLAYVACGRFDGYYERSINAWDIAAGALIVQEAGGSATNLVGHKNFLFEKNILASNGHLHQAFCEVTNQYFTDFKK